MSDAAKNSPTPWIAELIGVSDNGPSGINVYDILPAHVDGRSSPTIATVAGNDCALIVRAVNSHADLVDALQVVLEFAEEAGSGFISGTGSDIKWQEKRDASVADARAALAKARQ